MLEPRSFIWLADVAAVLCGGLAVAWSVFNRQLLGLFGAGWSPAAGFVARRGAALFLGIAVLLWRAALAPTDEVRMTICLGVGAACAVLALLGIAEFRCHRAGAWIWLAIVTEAALACTFFILGR